MFVSSGCTTFFFSTQPRDGYNEVAETCSCDT